jgi:two-component system chemotaxis sensor kinase CheA
MGLMVDEILDVLEERLAIEPAGERPGYLGSCVLAGKVTGILDTSHWLRLGQPDWFGTPHAGAARPRILLVEDSAFFRNLAGPALSSAGFDVVSVGGGRDALHLREAGERFDAVISDIDMPDLDGHALARAIREGGAWAELPLIALSGRARPEDIERGRAAGFSDYVAKFDRDALVASLRGCLQPGIAA